jgi:uridine monophosphate synthetase
MNYTSSVSSRIAEALFNSGCLKFGSFTIKSGATSPYYIDLAHLLSSPKDFFVITDSAVRLIKTIMVSDHIDKLASIELKGALIVPSIACELGLPAVVVRKEAKAYGATGRTAGADIAKGEHILLFDDVISEGLSKLEGIRPLEELGAHVEHVMVVVNREQGGKESLEGLGYEVHALVKVSEMVEDLARKSKITLLQRDSVLRYVRRST